MKYKIIIEAIIDVGDHDINLLPEIRRQGIARQILPRFWDWPVITLVAADTVPYWEQHGFKYKYDVDYGQYMIKKHDHINRKSD